MEKSYLDMSIRNSLSVIDFKNLSFEDEKKEYKTEPVLLENKKRFVLFPIQYNDMWRSYKNIEAHFWTAEDLEFQDDLQGFSLLTGKAKSHVCQLVALLLHDILDSANIPYQFSSEIQVPEARCFYGFQIMQHNVHGELVGILLDVITPDQAEYRSDTVELVANLPSVARQQGWTQRYITDSTEHYSVKLAAYAIFQSIFSSSVLNLLFHLGKDAIMPGLVHAIAKIRHDRETYTQFCHTIRHHLVNEIPQDLIRQMITECVSIERQRIDDLKELALNSLSFGALVIDFESLKMKVMNLGDLVMQAFGYQPIYGGKDPLPWIETLYTLEMKKEDHDEQKIQKVQKTVAKPAQQVFSIDEDF